MDLFQSRIRVSHKGVWNQRCCANVQWQAGPAIAFGRQSFVCLRPPTQGHAMSKVRALDTRHKTAPALDTPTDLSEEAVRELSAKLNAILADAFALYVKTKNFHWHVSGPHFRDYHLLLDEQG